MRKLILAIAAMAGCGSPAPEPKPTVLPSEDWAGPPSSAPRSTKPTPPSFRLPTDVVPQYERVELTIDPTQPRATGTIHIDAIVRAQTNVVWLNAADLHVHDATIGGRPARVVEHGDMLELVPSIPLVRGSIAITAAFDAPIDAERSRGMYSAIDHGEPYVYTFFEPIDARRAFPCFDEPSFKVPWKLSLHVPTGDVALGNAPVVSEHGEEGGKLVELAESKPLPSYLVAFVVGPFDVVDAGVAGHHGTPLRFVVPRGRGAETSYAA